MNIILLNSDKNEKNLVVYNQIRKKIFLNELKYKNVTDIFDKKSLHFLIQKDDETIGVVRVAPELWGKLPCSKRYGINVRGNSVEISRLAITKDYRGKINKIEIQEIYTEILKIAKSKISISSVFFSTVPAFANLIKRSGIHLQYTGKSNTEDSIYRQLYEFKI